MHMYESRIFHICVLENANISFVIFREASASGGLPPDPLPGLRPWTALVDLEPLCKSIPIRPTKIKGPMAPLEKFSSYANGHSNRG